MKLQFRRKKTPRTEETEAILEFHGLISKLIEFFYKSQ